MNIAQAAIKYAANKTSNTLPHSLRLHHFNQVASAEALRVKASARGSGSGIGPREQAVRVMQQMPVIAQCNQQLFQRYFEKTGKTLVVALNAGAHNPAVDGGVSCAVWQASYNNNSENHFTPASKATGAGQQLLQSGYCAPFVSDVNEWLDRIQVGHGADGYFQITRAPMPDMGHIARVG